MLENDHLIDEFKKSLTSTIKSISKNENIEINFVKDSSSIDGQIINILEPNIKSIKNNLNYIRAEADSMALELRFHKNIIHQKYLGNNELANKIFYSVEQSRVEAKGSKILKGVNDNIKNKHKLDLLNLSNQNNQNNTESELVRAFRYVSYSELSENKLKGKFSVYKKILEKKLGTKYNEFFLKLKNNLSSQEDFANLLKLFLDDLGFYENDKKNNENESIDDEDNIANEDKNDQNNQNNDKNDSKKVIEVEDKD